MHAVSFMFFATVLCLAASVIGWMLSQHQEQMILALSGRSPVAMAVAPRSQMHVLSNIDSNTQRSRVTYRSFPTSSLSSLDQEPLPLAA
jgi:hypothetical protein